MVCLNNEQAKRIYEYGVHVTGATTIMRPAAELYSAWKNVQNLPRIVDSLLSVEETGEGITRWKTEGPGGPQTWEAKIIADELHHRISWQSTANSPVQNAGSVLFEELPHDRGTMVRLVLEYIPPGGKVGHGLAKMWGDDPRTHVHRALHRFRQVMETGEIPTARQQPAGHNRLRSDRAGEKDALKVDRDVRDIAAGGVAE